jgi:tripartite-type tricarboxylate transporter receptor subunit TctC
VPAERMEILRNAFDQMMKDPGFLEDAKKAGMDTKPISGAEIQSLVKAIVQSAPEDIEFALKLTQ